MKNLIAIIIVALIPFSTTYAQKRSQIYKDYYDGKNNYNYSDGKATLPKRTTNKVKPTNNRQNTTYYKSSSKNKANEATYTGSKSFLNADILRHRIILEPEVHIPFGIRKDRLQEHLKVAGGVRLGYQYNFYNWLGLRGDIGYIYGSAEYNLSAPHYQGGSQHERLSIHQIDIRALAVIEYRPQKGKSGINPYLAAGATFSTSINFLNEKHTEYLPNPNNSNIPDIADIENNLRRDDFNIGLSIGAGFNYIFNNGWSVGAGFEYTLVMPYWDNTGFRVFITGAYLF